MSSSGLEIKPVWYQPEAPLGSAVRYLTSISPRFSWVGIYLLKGKWLELGPSLGEGKQKPRIPVGKAPRSELVVLIRDKTGKILGQIDIESPGAKAFAPEEERVVRQVADELGHLWPA